MRLRLRDIGLTEAESKLYATQSLRRSGATFDSAKGLSDEQRRLKGQWASKKVSGSYVDTPLALKMSKRFKKWSLPLLCLYGALLFYHSFWLEYHTVVMLDSFTFIIWIVSTCSFIIDIEWKLPIFIGACEDENWIFSPRAFYRSRLDLGGVLLVFISY